MRHEFRRHWIQLGWIIPRGIDVLPLSLKLRIALKRPWDVWFEVAVVYGFALSFGRRRPSLVPPRDRGITVRLRSGTRLG
jgi:hypothetical protein